MFKKIFALTLLLLPIKVFAQTEEKPSLEIYGQFMTDIGYNFGQLDPLWFDVMRPSKLPAYPNEFGGDGSVYFSIRQTKLGFKVKTPTKLGELMTFVDFDFFGVGKMAGEVAFHLRYAYLQLGKFGIGQVDSPFQDVDVFPNTVEYWGPSGVVAFRNVQFRYMPLQGRNRLTFAIERPGASADEGIYADRQELEGVRFRFPMPDVSGEFRMSRDWGYAEVAGIVRRIVWDDYQEDGIDLNGSAWGWGINLSTNIKVGDFGVIKGQVVGGEAFQSYLDDASADIGVVDNPDGPSDRPFEGVAMPQIGVVLYYNHSWGEKLTSAFGWSVSNARLTDQLIPSAFQRGDYVSGNLMYHPFPNVTGAAEVIFINRRNFSDGFTSQATKLQFSFRYSFSHIFQRN
ncbi:DcaP family trimeric outer membrane transporter [Algoriphagus halophytocola]|uniref:DcaP family trimeric outer membrane transporter n=1 Tax=Algoriphagus halophytocola TaxID=2991499 RepID=A0ABY6MK14_9BACT|nr:MULTISPECIES: DcaP family trimeric outer membrane transporter [unclassified Algoriphagus]UZD23410.1 DcaP family trimeric outer membrane transporter [Algoriphagus sp. TR-M5]WBL44705.1 DcaP family trimeric outer membrane transporter [Algoriphagus sp. TR-M9]